MASKTVLIKPKTSPHKRVVNSDTTISEWLNQPKGNSLTQRKQNIYECSYLSAYVGGKITCF